MAAKKTRLQIIEYAEHLITELDGLVFDLKFYEEKLEAGDSRAAVAHGAVRPTPRRVAAVQSKASQLWKTLESYRVRVLKDKP
jgi:hypothetical protein